MLKLFFDLKYQNITLTNPGVTVASDSKNYLVAKFNAISNDWETPLSAIFVSTVDKVAYTVLVGQSANLAADECYVPWEVLRDSGEVYVSVFSGNLHTTNVAKFAVVKSGYVEGEIPPPPTPTVYEQILEELENKQDVIHLDNAIDEVYNPNGHYVLYYFDSQNIRHNIFDFEIFQELTIQKIYEILDQTLQGAQNVAPSLYVEPKGNNYALVYEDSEDVKHELFDFSNLPIGGTSDYTELENKPSINNVTLQGNKTSDDLNLQDKLTAGQNITIDEDNVISAEGGGVTSYNDLTDKPVLRIQTGSTTENITIEDVIKLTPFYKIFGTDIITLDTSRLYNKIIDGIHIYTDFDSISNTTRGGVVLCSINAEGIPSFINARNRKFVLYNFEGLHDDGCAQLIFWIDNTSGESKSAFRVGTGGLWQASDWVELTGSGSQIVSGVVNQNGTITFTNSDGTTFTTTGTSVIGFSPTATVTQTQSGATVSITDKNGTTTANISNGADGQDYVLTAQDKSDIADIVLSELPTTQGVLYGNTSN